MSPDTIERLLDLSRRRKRQLQVVADGGLMVVCFLAAMMLRLEHAEFVSNPLIWIAFLPVVPVTVVVFRRLGLYRSVMRFINGQAFRAIGVGAVVSAVALLVVSQAISAPVPRSVPFIYGVLVLCVLGGVRFVLRGILRGPGVSNRQRIAIYGAGEAGRQLQHALNHGQDYAAVAFIDDDPALQGTLVGGCHVVAPSNIPWLKSELRITSILLAVPSASRARRREIVTTIEPFGLEIKTVPGLADIVSGRAAFSDLRRVNPEDLLGRDPIAPRPDLMGRNITGKVVLVSGAGGSIGSELCRPIVNEDPAALVLFEVSEYALYAIATELRETLAREGRSVRIEPVLGSVQNPARVRAVLRAFGVQTIYHAAAYKHVVMVEENVVEGIVNNVFGTRVMAEAAAELGVESFILVSTDKAVRPTNFMGASKRMAELVCQGLARAPGKTTFSMVRFGNVLGSSGSVIPRFRAQIERGGPVTVTHREITRYFMTIPEASQLVIQAGAMARGGDVFVLDMGEPVRILDLAQTMIRLHGLKPYIIDGPEPAEAERGDIGIQIVGLNKGEKLFEELLIGNDPQGTEHPRIMTATEVSLDHPEMIALLERLQRACNALDVAAIRRVFCEAPLAYRPNDDALHDLMWTAVGQRTGGQGPRLKAIAAGE